MKKLLLLPFLVLFIGEMKSLNTTPLVSLSYTKDPARTPKEPRLSDPVTTVDGSTGKYRNKHKHPNGKNWARRRKHADTVKPKNQGKEKSKAKGTE